MKKLNIGMVGLGRVASSTHLPILKCFDEVNIAAAAEPDQSRAKRIQSLFGIGKIYTNYEELYEQERLDAVYICLPVFLHYDACKKALEKDIHVFCEKPMCISANEAQEITELARRKELLLMPGYKRRYAGNFQKAKTLIDAGVLGKIIQIEATFMTPGPYISWDPKSEWYLDPKWHGVIYDTGSYLVDLILYLVPSFPENVLAVSHDGFTGYETPTNLSCLFKMANGAVGTMNMGWRACNDIFHILIHGTAGSLTVSRDYFQYTNPGTDPVDKIKNYATNTLSEMTQIVSKIRSKISNKDFYKEDFNQTSFFVNALQKKGPLPISGDEAVRIHSFLEMIVDATHP